MNLERTQEAQRGFDKKLYDKWIEAVKDEYRPFQTIIEDDHEGFDENGDFHAKRTEIQGEYMSEDWEDEIDAYLAGYGEIASTIIFFGLEGVEVMTEEEYRDGA